jgi:hypothetical protein
VSSFDPSALDRLALDVADRPFMVTFAHTYRRLLPQRVRRLVTAISEGDLDGALDATLSLRVASAIVGAHELVEMASHLEDRIRTGDLAGADRGARLVPDAAHRTDHALAAYLGAAVGVS